MPALFLSYRRDDSGDVTGRVYDRLAAKFGAAQVFRDVDNIPLGITFPTHLKRMLGKSGVVLVIIGRTWTSATDERGRRRLDNPNDFVRLEVETALRAGVPVIPVLVSNAVMPTANELPASMRPLLTRNGIAVRPDPDFGNDIDRLVAGIERVHKLPLKGASGTAAPSRPPKVATPAADRIKHRSGSRWVMAGALFVLALAFLGLVATVYFSSVFFQARSLPGEKPPTSKTTKSGML